LGFARTFLGKNAGDSDCGEKKILGEIKRNFWVCCYATKVD